MPEHKRVFLDTAPVIYYVQRNEIFCKPTEKILSDFNDAEAEFVSSTVMMSEACVYPFRLERFDWHENLEKLIKLLHVEILPVDEVIALRAAQIRAKHKSFQAMDSIQLAAAIVSDCDTFLTNDKRLKQFTEITCLTLTDFNA